MSLPLLLCAVYLPVSLGVHFHHGDIRSEADPALCVKLTPLFWKRRVAAFLLTLSGLVI